jgi:hypothetical protein
MKTVFHSHQSRGHANHGWLNSYHSFSFANYFNAQKMNFGLLRVLNDDTVAPGMGFGTHPHDNMEIISIPLSGDLKHRDSMGNEKTIKEGELQVMSAGSGVTHSEFNPNQSSEAKFLQIWIVPNKRDVLPRYDQQLLPDLSNKNYLHQVLSPNADDAGVWIHQNAWFHIGLFDEQEVVQYPWKSPTNGLYAFVLEGEFDLGDHTLGHRDALGIWDTNEITIKATAKDSRILLIEVPLTN